MTSHTMFEAMLRDPSKEERTKIFFAIKKIRSNNVVPCNVGGGRGSTRRRGATAREVNFAEEALVQEYQDGHIRLVLHRVQLDQQYREHLLYQHHQVYQQGHVDQDNLVFQYVV